MSNYPGDIDDDSTLPVVNDNLSEIGGEAVNALRDAVVQIETALGTNIAGSAPSLAARLGVFINPDGSPNASVLTSLGLVTLPITNSQIAEAAGIPESKLHLDYRTQDLFNYIRDLSLDVNTVTGWISITGIKLDPHLIGALYRHTLDQIDVSNLTANYLKNNLRQLRDNDQSYALVSDINNELLAHQWADGSPFGSPQNIVTNNGSIYKSIYGHTASGIFLNSSRFTHIPQTDVDLQLFAEFVDGNIINQLITLQNLNSNGISKVSRSSSLLNDGYGQPLVPVTPAAAYLKHLGNSSSPYDDIDTGDDIIEFIPSTTNSANSSFDEKFALVRIGDIIRINYGTVEVPFIIKEKKYVPTPGNKRYLVRIAGKNLSYSPNATARIDRSLVNSNKYGVLAVAPANNTFSEIPSLIVTSPRGGEALGLGFSPDEFNESHYQLYLALYPDGNPADGYTFLPAIDVTGNQGITPGLYTLDSIVEATNTAFRKVGFNYRFIAFQYQGEFGIALADSYNNAGFSVINGVVAPGGTFDQAATVFNFPNNVVDLFPTIGTVPLDPLGFGVAGAAIASPPYLTSYGSEAASQYPTKLFVPLSRNNTYINGAEKERLSLEIGQALDTFGDGYWVAEILVPPGSPPSGRVETTYRINLDLSATNLKAGKTLVVQSLGQGSLVDFGRFIIEGITFGCNPTSFTDITVYDAVHAKGFSPAPTLGADGYVALYFNSDSVSFNEETATDYTTVSAFKRHFEVYIDENVNTFTHERGRMLISAPTVSVNGITLYSSTELAKLDLIKISPKLRGYQFGSVNKITFSFFSYDSTSGIFTGNLASYDGAVFTHAGPFTTGKKGEVVRFYDETNIDYIDVIFDVNTVVSSFSNGAGIPLDVQLFPTLSLDDQVMLIGTCQLNDSIKKVTRIRDERQFGNISTQQLSTSTLDYIALPEKLLHFNGVIRGFDIATASSNIITFNGGVALVSGKLEFINNQIFSIPKVSELFAFTSYPINWALCVNSIGELTIIPLTDFDSVVGTPNSPNRIVTVTNAVTLNTYSIDASDFKTILNTRKDLTMLYIVTSTVTGTGGSAVATLSIKDIRRYVNDQDSNMPAVVNNNLAAQGNFKDINTALTWIRFNNALQSELILKGAISAIAGNFIFTTGQLSIRPGGSGATLKFSGSANVANFRLTDMPTLVGGGSGTFATTIFDNSPLTVNSAGTLTSVNLIKCGASSFTGNLTATNTNFSDGSVSVGPTGSFSNVSFINCPLGIGGGPVSAFTNVRLVRSATNIGASAGVTFFSNATVANSPITISGSGGIEFDSTLVSNSAVSTGGSATIGVIAGSTGTSFIDSSLAATTTFTTTGALFNRSNVTANGAVSLTSTRFVDSSLTTAASASLTTSSGSYENVTFSSVLTASLTGTRFVNCTMTVSTTSTISSCYFQNCTVTLTGSTNITNTIFDNCTLVFTAGGTFTNVTIDPSTLTIGGTITVTSTTITDSTIASSAVNTFLLVNDFRLERNKITWTGAPVTGYTSSDIVNSSNGMIWATLGAAVSVNNIFIKDNIITTALQDHFPFFALQMTSYSAVANNISVTGNSFISTAGGDDVRAAIAVISTLVARTTTTAYPQAPALIDVHFDKNICNYNQLIIISSIKDYAGGYMNGAAPLTINTTISGNVCGTIGYFISSFAPFDGTNVGAPNNGTIRDKGNKLVISDNSCKLITNLDSVGDYICFRATAFPSANFYEEVISTIGEVAILNNECNWIQVGAGGYTVGQSGASIIGNTVFPSNSTFLNNFTSFGFQSVTPSNVGILLRREYNAISNSSSIIAENNIVQKFASSSSTGLNITNATNANPIVITTASAHGFSTGQLVNIGSVTGNTAANGTWVITVLTTTTFSIGAAGNGVYAGGGNVVSPNIYYYGCAIVCFNHARIQNNVIAGVVNATTAPMMYFWDIASQIVTGNTMERRGLSCQAYFTMDGLSGPGTAAQKLIITNNTLDAVDSGAGIVNRYFVAYSVGYATGAAVGAVQTGWRVNSNVGGTQGAGFVYV